MSQSIPVIVSYVDESPSKGRPYPLNIIGEPPPVQIAEYLRNLPGYAEGTALMVVDGSLEWVAI